MNRTQAAFEVLKEAQAPLTAEEITQRILQKGLWETAGKTPSATVASGLYVHIKKKGAVSLFVKVGKNQFALASSPEGSSSKTESSSAKDTAASPGMLSYTEAAARLLEMEGTPVHYRDIADRVLASGWVASVSQSPAHTLNAALHQEIKRQRDRGDVPRFTMLGKGFVALTAWQGAGLEQQIQDHNERVKAEMLGRLKAMDPFAFESLVQQLLVALGFEAEKTSNINDGGIDVRGTLVVGGTLHTRLAVQVKRFAKNVQAPIVQQVRGSLGVHEQGMIVTTAGFSKDAQEEALQPNKTPIGLMDGTRLVDLLVEHSIGVLRQEVYVLSLPPQGTELEATSDA